MAATNLDAAYGQLLIASIKYREELKDERMAWQIDQVMNDLEELVLIERRRAEVKASLLTTNSD